MFEIFYQSKYTVLFLSDNYMCMYGSFASGPFVALPNKILFLCPWLRKRCKALWSVMKALH